MKPLRPMDLVYLRCPECGAPSFTVDQLSNPIWVDEVVHIAAMRVRDGKEFTPSLCADCKTAMWAGKPPTVH